MLLGYIYYEMYRAAIAVSGESRDPAGAAAALVAMLLTVNVLSIVVLLYGEAYVARGDASLVFAIALWGAAYAVCHLVFLRKERWRSVVSRGAELRRAGRMLSAGGALTYVFASLAAFAFSVSSVWPSK